MSEDNLIIDATRRILADFADPQVAATGAPGGWKAALWPQLEAAGLTRAWLSEAQGGADVPVAAGFDILRLSGQFAGAAPLAETLLAGWTLARAGLELPDGPMTVGPLRPHDRLTLDAVGQVSGGLHAVPFGGGVDRLAGLALDEAGGAHVVLLDLAAGRVVPRRIALTTERVDIVFDAATPVSLAPAPKDFGPADFEALGAVIRVQQMAGALETALQLATAYAGERVAFGRPIGKFQAVQQNLARLGGEVAAALTAAASAADTLACRMDGGAVTEADLLLEIAAAKIRVGEAATEGAAIAHQVHGAIGFTSEYQLQRFTRQLWSWRDDFGSESAWALRLGRATAEAGADALWPALTRR